MQGEKHKCIPHFRIYSRGDMNANTDLPHDPVLKMYNNAVGRVACIMGQRMLLFTVPITSLGLQGNSN